MPTELDREVVRCLVGCVEQSRSGLNGWGGCDDDRVRQIEPAECSDGCLIGTALILGTGAPR